METPILDSLYCDCIINYSIISNGKHILFTNENGLSKTVLTKIEFNKLILELQSIQKEMIE